MFSCTGKIQANMKSLYCGYISIYLLIKSIFSTAMGHLSAAGGVEIDEVSTDAMVAIQCDCFAINGSLFLLKF